MFIDLWNKRRSMGTVKCLNATKKTLLLDIGWTLKNLGKIQTNTRRKPKQYEQSCIDLLDEIEFKWNFFHQFTCREESYALLLQYKNEEQHYNVPQKHKMNCYKLNLEGG
jgi:hypothetical protein